MDKLKWPTVVGLVAKGSNGSDWWRTIIPFVHLKQAGYPVWTAYYEQVLNLQHKPDVLVMNRAGLADNVGSQKFLQKMRENRIAVVIDQDDDARILPPTNPHYVSEEFNQKARRGLQVADLVTCSTPYLAEQFSIENPHVSVLPNLIDPDQWKASVKENRPLTIGVFGGDSHSEDWEICRELFPFLAEIFPQLHFIIAGFEPWWFGGLRQKLGNRIENIPWVPVDQYQQTVGKIDIGLCPLLDTPYNRAKSPIKWMEFAMMFTPVVASPTVYGDYIRPGTDGFIASSLSDWMIYTSHLVESRVAREKIGNRAKQRIIKDFNVHDPGKLYERMKVYSDCYNRIFGGKEWKPETTKQSVLDRLWQPQQIR